jgi:2-dehydropantoate 2-reductase
MPAVRRYAVIGLGAVGGLYGGRLAAAGHEVHFVVRRDAERLRRDGLQVTSVDGDIDLPQLSVFDEPAAVPPVDVVVVATKTTANPTVTPVLQALAPPAGVVVLLQNGLDVEGWAAQACPGATVLGGLCFVCAHNDAPGRITHLDYGAVNVAEHRPGDEPAGVTPAVDAVAGDLAAAGVKATAQPDLVLARWKKLVWNVPYNGLSVVLDAGTDELMADPATLGLVRRLMVEVQAGATAQGREIPDAFVEQMLADTVAMTPYRTSMRLDHDAGRPLELDAIYRAPLARAAAGGVAMPATEVLWRQLSFLDRRSRPGGTPAATSP